MATLTICLPENRHERLKELAKRRNVSVDKLVEELSTITLAKFDAETRFRAIAAKGSQASGLELIYKLNLKDCNTYQCLIPPCPPWKGGNPTPKPKSAFVRGI